MNKEELLDAVVQKAKLPKKEVAQALDATLDTIADSLAKGERVTLIGFGTFQTRERAARTGRNPRTGQPIQIKARRAAAFTPGKRLTDQIK